MLYYVKKIDSPLGKIYLASDGVSLCGLWFEGQKYFFQHIKEYKYQDIELFDYVEKWLDGYFLGKRPPLTFSLNLQGSEFRKLVWKLLLEIPYGSVTTYNDLAKKVACITGKNKCAQAVGQAIGHNPISIIVPCHRVIGSNQTLTGYAGGIEKKIYLLEHEGYDVSKLRGLL